jgi:hypothetical protein
MKNVRRTRVAALAGAAVLACAMAAPAGAATVVADHLNNPRGLEFGPDGALYIAEAGKAGTTCLDPETCAGLTGSIVRVSPGGLVKRILTGLVSVGGKDGSFTVGVDDVSVSPGGRVVTVATSAGPNPPPGLPAPFYKQLGNLLGVNADGSYTKIADIDDVEFNHDPDGQGVDSDPYSVLAVGHAHELVTDAAGNDLLEVRGSKVSVLAKFPNNRWGGQSVPTSVAQGPDGAYYVGELGGEGTPNGGSRVWRVVPGQKPQVYRRGLTAITDLTFGPDGSLYVSQFTNDIATFSPNGSIIRIRPNGTRTTLGSGQVHFPGGVAVSASGHVYVSNWSILPAHTPAGPPFGGANGQVIRL